MPRSLLAGALWLTLGAGAAGLELNPFRRSAPLRDPDTPLGTELAKELASVEHEGYFCAGAWGVDRKKLTGSEVESSPQACAAGAERDPECGQELYFGISRAGQWQCRCVLAGRSCLRERAPQGALFTVFRFGAAGGLPLGEHRASPQQGVQGKATPEQSHSALGESTVPAAGGQLEAELGAGAPVAAVPLATLAPWADVGAAPTRPTAERGGAAEEWPSALPPAGPPPAAAAGADAPREGQREHGACAPTGHVGRFLSEPPHGWHLQGHRESYAACAAAGHEGGFANVAWNKGSSYFGDCYAIKDDMPSSNSGDCADYCWVFGAACKPVLSDAAGQAQTTAQRQLQVVPTEPPQPQPPRQPQPQPQMQRVVDERPQATEQSGDQPGEPEADLRAGARPHSDAQPAAQVQARPQVPPPYSPSPAVEAQPRQSQPPPRELLGQPGEGFCAGPPLYDGPTTGWEDCRTRCDVVGCRFWSYWHNSGHHWCKLTLQCAERRQDGHYTISAYQTVKAAARDDGPAPSAWAPPASGEHSAGQRPSAREERESLEAERLRLEELRRQEEVRREVERLREEARRAEERKAEEALRAAREAKAEQERRRLDEERERARAEEKLEREQARQALEQEKRRLEQDRLEQEQARTALEQEKLEREQARQALEQEKRRLEQDRLEQEQARTALEQEKLEREQARQALEQEHQEAHALASRQACAPRGAARRFARPPRSGWHDLGKVGSYVDCANAAGSTGYRNLVWNNGSAAAGRCYGFAHDVPELLQRGCEATYCWLFGPACDTRSQDAEEGQNLSGTRLVDSKAKDNVKAEAKAKSFAPAARRAEHEPGRAVRGEEEDEARAIADAEERMTEAAEHRRATERPRSVAGATPQAGEDAARAQRGGGPRSHEELEAWGDPALEARAGGRARGAAGGAGAQGAAPGLGRGAAAGSTEQRTLARRTGPRSAAASGGAE
ncbi:unnamed protein product [Prorocentrum cordatum]|uniref:Cellulase n=1 Tax=Prorocentrum cordatum TaxID=2364126 RepID=A0ABN9U3I9_9DINO|nr:unnamed protein product [Polarella glacialis]